MDVHPTYAPLVPACKMHGIGRSTAFELARRGDLKTYKVGARTFVDLESLRTLPERLASPNEKPQQDTNDCQPVWKQKLRARKGASK